jgi:tRNA pseudouridine32 synthase/23S rRNA pseudouridine746 synthase
MDGSATAPASALGPWSELRADWAVHEDEHALVLNKPAGVSVTGERHDTDLVRTAKEAGEQLYPAHRIDKVTSGVVLLARDLTSHGVLTRQFQQRTVEKVYLAITRSTGLPADGVIDLPLITPGSGRVRIAAERASIGLDPERRRWTADPVFDHTRIFPSVTRFVQLWSDADHTLLALSPLTGRRHQIRVHLAWIGHPIAGDPLFDKTAQARGERTALHSWRLGYDAPWAAAPRVVVTAAPGDDFWAPVRDRLPAGVLTDPIAFPAATVNPDIGDIDEMDTRPPARTRKAAGRRR